MPGAQAEQQCSTGTVSTGSSRGGCAQSAALPRACQLHPAPPRHDGYQPNPSQRTTYLRFPFCTNSWGCRVLIYRVLEATALQSSISPGKRPGEARSSFIGRAVWREEAFPGSVYRAGSNPASPWSRGLGKILTYKGGLHNASRRAGAVESTPTPGSTPFAKAGDPASIRRPGVNDCTNG